MDTRGITFTLVYFDVTKLSFISFFTLAVKPGYPINTVTINTGLRGTLVNIYLTVSAYFSEFKHRL